MDILVCVKQSNGELNPFDASALETALRIKDRRGARVTVISMGRPDVAAMLADLTRRGADRAILLTDQRFAGADTLATAYTLAQAARRLQPDLIICGRQSIDGDTAQTGPCLAATLGWPQIIHVLEAGVEDSTLVCRTRTGSETASLPVLITVECRNPLRFFRIGSRAAAVESWDAAAIQADPARCGMAGSPTHVLRTYESDTGLRECRFIKPRDLADVISRVACKAKPAYNEQILPGGVRLAEVWAIGGDLAAIADPLAEHLTIIPPQAPETIAALARAHQPDAILWKADTWGRNTAPRVAALLQTGLCADCTGLETDGKTLYMMRPSFGGSIMVRIACRTRPQMATVRTPDCSRNDIIVAGGRGARHCFGLVEKLAAQIGVLGASRSAVDLGLAPYEAQVGLTGRFVSPMLYLACGISGAVQHTCAIERAGTIIAINTDPQARIFAHADYGIIGDVAASLENYFQKL